MKKTSITAIAILLGLAILTSAGLAFGREGMHRNRGPRNFGIIGRFVQENLAAQSLSELTGQPVEVMQKRLGEEHLPALIREYNIEPDAFRSAMITRETALIDQLVQNGLLTEMQKEKIRQHREERFQRKEIMKRLVEKGIADGTLTREEATLLRPRGRRNRF